MNKKKKIIIIVSVVVIVAAIITTAFCVNGSAHKETPKTTTASTTAKAKKKETKPVTSTEEDKSDTSTTTTAASEKTTARKKSIGKAPSNANHEKKPAPAPAVPTTAAPTTTKPSGPVNISNSKNAWGTPAQMEASLAKQAKENAGYKYYGGSINTISDGTWSYISNYEVANNCWESRIVSRMRDTRINASQNEAARPNTVKVFFITRDNYKTYLGDDSLAQEINDASFTGPADEVLAVVVAGYTYED